MKHGGIMGLRFSVVGIALVLIISLITSSCATTKPKEYERAGIKGSVIPVDSDGDRPRRAKSFLFFAQKGKEYPI